MPLGGAPLQLSSSPSMKSPTAAANRRGCALGFFLPLFLLLLFPFLFFYSECNLPPFRSSSSPLDPASSLFSSSAARGTGLLHMWSDEELFRRALNSTSPRTEHQRRRFLGGSKNTSQPTPKVAFLFLTTGELPFEKLWERFFKGHEKLHNTYVHLDPFRFETVAKSPSIFWGRYVPSRATRRASPSLVSAMRRLLANAVLDDRSNQFFAFISDSCVPLHGFRRLYKHLVRNSGGRSFVEVITKSDLLWSRYNARGENRMLPEVPFDRFTVGSQWFVVNRRHAEMLLGETSMWDKFKLPCLPEFSAASCYTEEHYFSTVMNSVDPQGTHGYSLTHVNWPENTDGHPTTYQVKDVTKEFIQSLQAENNGRFMFARKFDPSCLQPLLELADVIFKH